MPCQSNLSFYDATTLLANPSNKTDCTVSAVQHRIQRLRDKAAKAGDSTSATNGGENGNEGGVSSAASSPEKRKRGRPKKVVPAEENANPTDAGEEGGSPTKLLKGSKAQPMVMEQGQHEVKAECSEEFA